MTTPAVSGQGDGLVRPVNAPSGQPVVPGVQPGTSGGLVLAQYVIVFGNPGPGGSAPGLFIYSGNPGPGNPPVLSDTLATEDPYGNPIAPGIAAGKYGGVQAILSVLAGFGQVLVPTGSSLEYEAGGMAGLTGTGGAPIAQIFSPLQAAPGQPMSDRIVLSLLAPGAAAGGSATWEAVYIDANGTAHLQIQENYSGTEILGASAVTGVQPGTGTSSTNAAVSETWHTASLQNGWGASNGVGGVFYQLLPWGLHGTVEVIGDIVHATATGNSVFATLPAGYTPAVQQNHPASWNNPVLLNSASVPWVNAGTGGALQMTGIEQAAHETFFHIFIPLGAL